MCDWLRFWEWIGKRLKIASGSSRQEEAASVKRAKLPSHERDTGKPRPSKREPVLVRGRLWKDTSAPAPKTEAQPEVEPASDIPELTQRLKHPQHAVRVSAAEALGRIGLEAKAAIPALLLAAANVDATLREAALNALNQIDSAWPKNPESRKAVPCLVKALGGGLSSDAGTASRLLSQIGAPALSQLVEALADEENDICQVWVTRTLGRIASDVPSAVPSLAKALNSQHSHVREAAAEALSEFGQAAEPAVPALVFSLGDWRPGVRRAAAISLARVGGAAELAIPALIQRLADRDREVREAAFEALAQIGTGTVPSLMAVLEARDLWRMAEWLKWAIEVSDWYSRPISDDFQREPLKAINNVSWCFSQTLAEQRRVEAVHEAALRLLGEFGPDASAAVPVVTQALSDSNPRIRLAAALALGHIGPQARVALPDLVRSLVDRSETVRKACPEVLGKIDPDWASSPEVQPFISSLVKHLERSREAGQLTVEAFAVIGPPSVPVLIEALETSDNRIVRERAAKALGLIGPGAREAIPALTEAAHGDSHGWVREAAAEALRKIAPQ